MELIDPMERRSIAWSVMILRIEAAAVIPFQNSQRRYGHCVRQPKDEIPELALLPILEKLRVGAALVSRVFFVMTVCRIVCGPSSGLPGFQARSVVKSSIPVSGVLGAVLCFLVVCDFLKPSY